MPPDKNRARPLSEAQFGSGRHDSEILTPPDQLNFTAEEISLLERASHVTLTALQAAVLVSAHAISEHSRIRELTINLEKTDRECFLRDGHLILSRESIHRHAMQDDFLLSRFIGIPISSLKNYLISFLRNGGSVTLSHGNDGGAPFPIEPRLLSDSSAFDSLLGTLNPGNAIKMTWGDAIEEQLPGADRSTLPGAQARTISDPHSLLELRGVEDTLLMNCELDGRPRYALPSQSIGEWRGYSVFYRPAPARLIHFSRSKEITLNHNEFFLVPHDGEHTIAISVDDTGRPQEAYVNLNTSPKKTENGVSWRDYELDVKLFVEGGEWRPILLDIDEFNSHMKDQRLAEQTRQEADRMIDKALRREEPFLPPGELRVELAELLTKGGLKPPND